MKNPQGISVRCHRALRNPIFWSIILAAVVTGIMVYSLSMGSRFSRRHIPWLDAVMEIKNGAAVAHLDLEEILGGDSNESISVVWEHLDRCSWFARTLMEGGENHHFVFVPIRNPQLRQEISDLQRQLETFRALAEERWARAELSGVGTEIDQRSDAVFEELFYQSNVLEDGLVAAIAKDLSRFRAIQGSLIAICLGLSLFVGVVLQRYRQRHALDISALRESETRYRTLVDRSPDGIFIADLEGRFITINKAMTAGLGYAEEEFLSGTIQDFLLPEYVEQFESMLAKVLAGDETEAPAEYGIRTKDGGARSIEVLSVPYIMNGEVVGIQGIARDITERKKVEKALQASEHRFRTVLDSTPFPVGIADVEDNKILFWSRSASAIFGHTPTTTEEWYLVAYPDPDYRREVIDRWKPMVETARESGRTVNTGEYRVTCADGSVRTCELHASFSHDNLIVTFNDITDRRNAEREVLASRERLRALATELSATEEKERHRIATYLHDRVGQSLAIMQLKLGALAEEAGAGKLTGSIEEISELLDGIMDETQTLTFELSPPILYELGLSAAIEWLGEKTAQENGLQFFYDDDGRPKPLDSETAAIVFRNVRELMVNVVRHADADRITASYSIDDGDLRVTIEDDGSGFNVAEASRIGPEVRFGLFSIRERIRLIGGRLEIESSPGRGTRATIVLPPGGGRNPGTGASS